MLVPIDRFTVSPDGLRVGMIRAELESRPDYDENDGVWTSMRE